MRVGISFIHNLLGLISQKLRLKKTLSVISEILNNGKKKRYYGELHMLVSTTLNFLLALFPYDNQQRWGIKIE